MGADLFVLTLATCMISRLRLYQTANSKLKRYCRGDSLWFCHLLRRSLMCMSVFAVIWGIVLTWYSACDIIDSSGCCDPDSFQCQWKSSTFVPTMSRSRHSQLLQSFDSTVSPQICKEELKNACAKYNIIIYIIMYILYDSCVSCISNYAVYCHFEPKKSSRKANMVCIAERLSCLVCSEKLERLLLENINVTRTFVVHSANNLFWYLLSLVAVKCKLL